MVDPRSGPSLVPPGGGLCKLTKAAQQALKALEASRVDVVGALEARRSLAGHSLIDDMITAKESQLAAHDAAIEFLENSLKISL